MPVSSDQRQRRAELLNRLTAVGDSSKASFALLFTFFPSGGHVAAAESRVKSTPEQTTAPIADLQPHRGPKFLPERLVPARPDQAQLRSLSGMHSDLQHLLDHEEFDVQALRWLKRLDHELGSCSPAMFPPGEAFVGMDGNPYWVRQTNNTLASYLNHFHDESLDEEKRKSLPPRVTWAGTQAPSLQAYCIRCTLVPQKSPPTWSHRPVLLEDLPLGKLAALRLSDEWRTPRLRVLFWPFRVPVRFSDQPVDNTIAPRTIQNEQEVLADAIQAVEVAKSERATILLFPELSVSVATEKAIQNELARHRRGEYPILTVGGRTMRDVGENATANEAFVFGPHGELLLEHRKFTTFTADWGEGVVVREAATDAGHRIAVLESALGNLAVLICLDLLHTDLKEILKRAAYANLLLVPSLSTKTTAHQASANELYVSSLASTFVCNHRWCKLDEPIRDPLHAAQVEEGASFWRIPYPFRPFESNPSKATYFSFDLSDLVQEFTSKRK